jgi:hypothetical protein
MDKSVEFRSRAFPPQLGEDQEVNPGRYGKGSAQFLAGRLRERGVTITDVRPEDWGSRVPVANDDFPLWIGCGNLDGEDDGFLCFVEPSQPSLGGLFNRKDTRPAADRLATELYAILSASPDVEQLTWAD